VEGNILNIGSDLLGFNSFSKKKNNITYKKMTQQEITKSEDAKPFKSGDFMVGLPVLVFSMTKNEWEPGETMDMEMENQTNMIKVRFWIGIKTKTKKVDKNSTHLKMLPNAISRENWSVGTKLQYYSSKMKAWKDATVIEVNTRPIASNLTDASPNTNTNESENEITDGKEEEELKLECLDKEDKTNKWFRRGSAHIRFCYPVEFIQKNKSEKNWRKIK